MLNAMSKYDQILLLALSFFGLLKTDAAAIPQRDEGVAPEFRNQPASHVTSKTFGPARSTSVFKGAFQVDLVIISFADCKVPEPETVRNALNVIRGSTVSDYYKEYSQGITWPVLAAYPAVYVDQQPLGYYCRHTPAANMVGWTSIDDGVARAAMLRKNALQFVRRLSGRFTPGKVTCFVYCRELDRGSPAMEKCLRPFYPKPTEKQLLAGAIDPLTTYNPEIPWADPLWPNSRPQVFYPADGSTIVHELGHVLGAPDFYHATEKYDGLPGTPTLPWSWGPTGPAYCRTIYQAFAPPAAYPFLDKPGTYMLGPRSGAFPFSFASRAEEEAALPLGFFIPSAHPNYLFCVEFVYDEKPPIGTPGYYGLLIHLINVTMDSPTLGPPDKCYTYRPDDPFFRALKADWPPALLHDGEVFDDSSNPRAILPNQLPAGIAIRNIELGYGMASFSLEFQPNTLSSFQLHQSLLPIIKLTGIDEIGATSFRAHADVIYRGEPLLTEYGFCYGPTPHPTVTSGRFPLYHRDRYDARIIDCKPGATLHVRAYAQSERGIAYSAEEQTVTLPTPEKVTTVPPLLTDHLLGNDFITRWHYSRGDQARDTASAQVTLMSLAAYYHVVPGGSQAVKGPFTRLNLWRMHTSPSLSRPDFRMVEEEAMRTGMRSVAVAAGLCNHRFGDFKTWARTCASRLKIPSPGTNIIRVSPQDIETHAPRIKEWLRHAQPVLLVRESKQTVWEITHITWPLDIAILDGFNANGQFHVAFPLGSDRGNKHRMSGYYSLPDLLLDTTDSCLMFYRPR